MELKNYSKARKATLIAGCVVALLSLIVIFPMEKAQSYMVADLVFTFFGLLLSLVLFLIGFTGTKFINYLLFIIASAFISMICWYIVLPKDWVIQIIVVYAGAPSGIITALIFLILRYYLFFRKTGLPLNREQKVLLNLKQVAIYFLLLAVVSLVYYHGDDWIYDIFES